MPQSLRIEEKKLLGIFFSFNTTKVFFDIFMVNKFSADIYILADGRMPSYFISRRPYKIQVAIEDKSLL